MKVVLLAAVLGSLLSAGSDVTITVQVGDPAPSFAGKWLNHPPATLQDLAGRIVFIEVWRTW